MAGLAVFLLAIFASVAVMAFRRPHGVYRRTAIFGLGGVGGALAVALFASLPLGPNSGLGLAILLYGFWLLVILASLAAIAGATGRHLWNALRR